VRLAKGVAAANEGNCLDIVHAHLTKGAADVGHRLLRHGFTKDALCLGWRGGMERGGVVGRGGAVESPKWEMGTPFKRG
jgi:hypothetical protein